MSAGVDLDGQFFVGWDVGGWNCDTNAKSRDAIVILDVKLNIVGKPWRGNLREQINTARSAEAWIQALFALCATKTPRATFRIFLAIDTPLGFSKELAALVTDLKAVSVIGESSGNPYLFRATERMLFERALSPLSAIKDMIGSQATKGMHVLAKFAREVASCGVWTDGHLLTVLETYPSACKRSPLVTALAARYESLGHDDRDDALTCALIASLYATRRDLLAAPDEGVPISEGWIWVPKDSLGNTRQTGVTSAAP